MNLNLSIEEHVVQFEQKRVASRKAAARRANSIPEVERFTARIETMDDGKTVRLYLNLSQEERAIVLDKSLDAIVFYKDPIFTQDDIDSFVAHYNKEIADSLSELKFMEQFHEEEDEIAKERARGELQECRDIISEDVPKLKAAVFPLTLIDYLEYPFIRECSSRREAIFYADKLREIVGEINERISRYKTSE
jgi:hypothetical protein